MNGRRGFRHNLVVDRRAAEPGGRDEFQHVGALDLAGSY